MDDHDNQTLTALLISHDDEPALDALLAQRPPVRRQLVELLVFNGASVPLIDTQGLATLALGPQPELGWLAHQLRQKNANAPELVPTSLSDDTRTLLDQLPDAILVSDTRGRVQYANAAAYTLLGADLSALTNVHTLQDAASESSVEFNIEGASGEPRTLELRSITTQWRDRPHRLAVVRDVSRRAQSEARLHLLQRSIEASSNGIIITGGAEDDYPILYINPAFSRMTGYSQDDVLGKNCRILQGPDTEEERRREIREALEAQREVSVVMRNYRHDGEPFWNDLYIAPVPDEQGEVGHFVGILNDISAQRAAQSEMAFNASHDVLTGLPNRSLLEDRLEQALRLVVRHRLSLAVLVINLDGFKPVNDSLGHRTGDQLLVAVADRLGQSLRPGDTVARLGNDEFAVLLPDLAVPEDSVGIVEKLLARLSEPYPIDQHQLYITASIGIALSDEQVGDAMTLVQHANLAMGQAKRAGRNTYRWYTSRLIRDANHRVALRNSLEQAIILNKLQLHYQPQVNCQDWRFSGSEALVRWVEPERGIILPGEFIPLAEETGQIIRLGAWVLEQACRDNRSLIDAGFTNHRMAVNISPLQLRQPNFADTVRQALDRTGHPPELLDLEITESVLKADAEQIVATLEAIRDLGVGIVIDDFGSGYSSLSYIKHLPATKLKIDRQFIRDIISNRKDASITQGIIAMVEKLGLTLVVVGVETEAHAQFLKRNHCDVLQGQLFAHPVPFDELKPLLTKGPPKLEQDPESTTPTLLIIDDEPNILRTLTRLLRRDGYRILSTTDPQEAFSLLAENRVQVILSDQRMPSLSGTEFLSQVKDIYPETIRMVLSGYTDLDTITRAINEGAIYKFLTKPWQDDELRQTIRQAFQRYDRQPRNGRPDGASDINTGLQS